MWPFNRELRKRKGQPFYWLYVLINLVCWVAVFVGFAYANRLAAWLPQSTWFLIVMALTALVVGLWVGWNGPDVRWMRRQLSKLRGADHEQSNR
jgi:hypothetical protein